MGTELRDMLGSAKLTCDPSIPRRKAVWTVTLRMDGFLLEPPCGGVYSHYPLSKVPVLADWIQRHESDGLAIHVPLRYVVEGRVGELLRRHSLVVLALEP